MNKENFIREKLGLTPEQVLADLIGKKIIIKLKDEEIHTSIVTVNKKNYIKTVEKTEERFFLSDKVTKTEITIFEIVLKLSDVFRIWQGLRFMSNTDRQRFFWFRFTNNNYMQFTNSGLLNDENEDSSEVIDFYCICGDGGNRTPVHMGRYIGLHI